MTAIQAMFTDQKTVKTQQVYRLSLDVPIEKANETLKALGGIPDPQIPPWVAIVLIDPENVQNVQNVQPEKRHFADMSRAQQAGMLCQDEKFQLFCDALNADDAADEVRQRCSVDSRSELDTVPAAARYWDVMLTEFDSWRGKIGKP